MADLPPAIQKVANAAAIVAWLSNFLQYLMQRIVRGTTGRRLLSHTDTARLSGRHPGRYRTLPLRESNRNGDGPRTVPRYGNRVPSLAAGSKSTASCANNRSITTTSDSHILDMASVGSTCDDPSSQLTSGESRGSLASRVQTTNDASLSNKGLSQARWRALAGGACGTRRAARRHG